MGFCCRPIYQFASSVRVMFLFLPISDENPTPRKPLLTWSIIGLNILVFIYQMSLSNYDNQLLVNEYGVRPSVFSEFTNLHTLITSAFLHGGFMHLMSNMLFLYIHFLHLFDVVHHSLIISYHAICKIW